MPQIKSRVFEAAFSKSLILCGYDYWNTIEYFFKPDEDFIYYTSMADLQEKLNEISNNYHKYTHIVENAYKKSINNYTTEKFVERYLK
jgi:spore maturation protein CgeB